MNTIRILRFEPMSMLSRSPIDVPPSRADWWRGCKLFALLLVGSQLIAGCAIPHNLGTLKPPVGITSSQSYEDIKECMKWADKFSDAPLNPEEQWFLNGIETARFAGEGGRGRNGYSDHYVLCLIKRGYRWMPDAE
ncbi:hypothetical protein [Thiobacillus thioparus]|uniref:hypothetical protein n=1 Tax=Thiobacillus thioparus TaxID=931 RepID=UPI0012F8CD12|nr:hypothetical protein [Thiobacillus thioparus]